MNNLVFYKPSQEKEPKVKFRFDETLQQVITGRLGKFKRSRLPLLTVSIYNSMATFNSSARETLNLKEKNTLKADFYKSKDGLLFFKLSKTGLYKISPRGKFKQYVTGTSVLKSELVELNLMDEIVHLYLHPTSDNNVYLLQKVVDRHV